MMHCRHDRLRVIDVADNGDVVAYCDDCGRTVRCDDEGNRE
jgi:hypothetical protein